MKATPTLPATRPASASGHDFVVVASRFNGEVVQKLVDGALALFSSRGAAPEDVRVVWVPGALEIPIAAQRVVQTRAPAAIVCVGCVVKGGTDHYEHVCRATTDGIMRVAVEAAGETVVTNGVLTVGDAQQAWDRAGGAHGNKGAEAAEAAVELLAAFDQLDAEAAARRAKKTKSSKRRKG